MDMSSASVLVSRIRLSSALWCASVLRIDITDQPKAAICARTRGKSVEVSHIVTFSFVPPPVPVRPFTTTRTRHFTSRSIYYHTRVAKSINQKNRTKHIKNTLGPYSHLDSPGGASTAKTIPSMMNMTSAQLNMNHTLVLRPTKVDFSSSSFVVIVALRPSVRLSVCPSLARRSEVVSTDGWRMRRKVCFLKIDLTVHYS